MSEYNVICDFGVRHELINWEYNCNCESQFWYTGMEFKEYMLEKHSKIYSSDFNSGHRREYYLYKKELKNSNK